MSMKLKLGVKSSMCMAIRTFIRIHAWSRDVMIMFTVCGMASSCINNYAFTGKKKLWQVDALNADSDGMCDMHICSLRIFLLQNHPVESVL